MQFQPVCDAPVRVDHFIEHYRTRMLESWGVLTVITADSYSLMAGVTHGSEVGKQRPNLPSLRRLAIFNASILDVHLPLVRTSSLRPCNQQ
jgi:hypothetical protein